MKCGKYNISNIIKTAKYGAAAKKKHCKYFNACEHLYLCQMLNFRVASKTTATSRVKAVK